MADVVLMDAPLFDTHSESKPVLFFIITNRTLEY